MNMKKMLSRFQPLLLLLLLLAGCSQAPDEMDSSDMNASISSEAVSSAMADYPMKQEITVADLTIQVTAAYSTNILINREFGMMGQSLEEVTEGAYLFTHVTLTNTSAQDMALKERFAVLGMVGSGDNDVIWVKSADMTNQSNKDDVTYHLDKEFYKDDMILEAGQTKDLQLFSQLETRDYPVYLAFYGMDSNRLATFEIQPTEEKYVLTNEAAQAKIAEKFGNATIVKKEIMGYQFVDEDEGGFYYPFEVTTGGEMAYYFVNRDTGDIYSGAFDERYADYPAVPGEIIE